MFAWDVVEYKTLEETRRWDYSFTIIIAPIMRETLQKAQDYPSLCMLLTAFNIP